MSRSGEDDTFYREFEDVFDYAGTHVPTVVSLYTQYTMIIILCTVYGVILICSGGKREREI